MNARLNEARGAAKRRNVAALDGLEQWLRIPSISGDPAHRPDVARSADWIAQRLAKLTKAVRVVTSSHNPVVLARVAAARANAGTLVVYGHQDVKAPGPGWMSSPFKPVRRDGLLFARGASDDKGQFMAHVAAVEAWTEIGGPPLDVVFIVDGAEEIGSPGLAAVLSGNRDILGREATAIVVSDTKMAGPGRPTLTVSQRGMLGVKLVVSTGRGGVHAGRYGGAVIDPSQVLAAAITRAAHAVARLDCAGQPPGPTDAEVRAGAVGRALFGDRLAERSTTCGALTVTSLEAGSTAGAIPPTAKATLDIRLPPGMRPGANFRMIAGAIGGNCHSKIDIELTCVAATTGAVYRHRPSVRESLDRACRLAFDRPPRPVASGGSIPAVELLVDAFHQAPILLGLGPTDDGAHGPDERIGICDWTKGVDLSICLADFLSRSLTRPPNKKPRQRLSENARKTWQPGAAAFS